ncbi:putative protein EIN4-like [Capsicum annuum]|nr:putative protein EIN4-like [Capsicum annuum]
MIFFLTLQPVQTLPDPKVVDGIKMKLFGATTITRKIILEGGHIAVDDGSHSGSGSGAVVGANDALLTIFEITSHYDYDHTGCIDFSLDFAIYSECSACKCQDCKARHDGVINAINALTASVKKMPSKRGVIPSKRISYPYTPLEIKAAKRRRKDTSKASSSIEKRKIATPLSLSCTNVQCASSGERKNYLFKGLNISDEAPKILDEIPKKLTQLINDYSEWIADGPLKRHAGRPSSKIQKLNKILPTYLDMSGFLDQKVHTDWSMIETYRVKMGNPFDVQYVEGIAQQAIGSLNCSHFIAAYAEYLSDGLQVPNDGLDSRLLRKIYAALL